MRVHFYATLRLLAGEKTVELPLPAGATVRQLLDAVITRYPPMKEELFDEAGDLFPHVHVFVNGRDAPHLDRALDTTLSEKDRVDLFPAVAGG